MMGKVCIMQNAALTKLYGIFFFFLWGKGVGWGVSKWDSISDEYVRRFCFPLLFFFLL